MSRPPNYLLLVGCALAALVRPGLAEEPSRHWSFQVVHVAEPPADASGWSSNAIDCFVSARHREKGLRPAGAASRRTLIRRATFDLIGLPPSPEEVEAFVNDRRADAFAQVIDRLLASPHYGERWGRHWLDVVRYADTAGETADFPVPDAWRYRNYVVASFNDDKPYDQFLREQLAGDILASKLPDDAAQKAELITATGFIAISRRFGFNITSDHHLTIEDTIDTLGKSVLGLAIGCARCHDHKFDPITMADYYALYGIFDSTRYPFPGCEHTKVPRDMIALAAAKGSAPAEQAYAVAEGTPHNVKLQERGDPGNGGEEVPRRNLKLLGGEPVPKDGGSGRLALAGWLTRAENPLTARVIVNRIWQHHFGTGLVNTPNDFGTRGVAPTHPELLDWLADRFMRDGWSIKSLHRLIMLSATYGQATDGVPQQADPESRWLSRFQRRRLSAEEIRDAVLAVSGDLDGSPGGSHPFPDAKTWQFTQHNPFVAVYEHDRRSIYLMVQRIKRHPFLALFDGADPNTSTPERHTTIVPTQALYFMNDPFIHAKSAHLAARLLALADDEKRLDQLYQLMFARGPTGKETAAAKEFLVSYGNELSDIAPEQRPSRAWSAWIRVMMSSNEFLFVD